MSRLRRPITLLAFLLLVAALGTAQAHAQSSVELARAKAEAERAAEGEKKGAPADDADDFDDPLFDKDGADEGPSEYMLEIDGKKVTVRLGRTATVQVNGKPVKVKLTEKADASQRRAAPDKTAPPEKAAALPKGTRPFKGGGVSFAYPPKTKLKSLIGNDVGVNMWMFLSDGCALGLEQDTESDDTAETALEQAVADTLEDYGGPSKCQVSDVTITVAGKKVRGSRVDTVEDGELTAHEMFYWRGGPDKCLYGILVEDLPPEKGRRSPEAAEFVRLLEKTLKYDRKAAAE